MQGSTPSWRRPVQIGTRFGLPCFGFFCARTGCARVPQIASPSVIRVGSPHNDACCLSISRADPGLVLEPTSHTCPYSPSITFNTHYNPAQTETLLDLLVQGLFSLNIKLYSSGLFQTHGREGTLCTDNMMEKNRNKPSCDLIPKPKGFRGI